jgi:hypothetical protein
MVALDSVVAPVAKASFCLGKERLRVREGQDCDLFAMWIEYTNRRASLDVDLLYGLLGVTKSKYDILPGYNKSVEAVYTEASKNFLSAFPNTSHSGFHLCASEELLHEDSVMGCGLDHTRNS